MAGIFSSFLFSVSNPTTFAQGGRGSTESTQESTQKTPHRAVDEI